MADGLLDSRGMRKRLLLLITPLLLVASSVSAQSRDPYFETFTASYDLIYHELSETSALGGHFDIATTVKRDTPLLTLAGEVGINHFEDANVSSFLGGPRLRLPNINRNLLPFAQVFLGLYHCGVCDINDFAIQVGGGVDWRARRNSDLRIRTQLDVRHMFDDFDDFNAVRLAVGVVFPLNIR
jgi:hypothetical protein